MLKPITGKEAADRMDSDPGSVLFELKTFLTHFGLTSNELHAELLAGRILCQGRPVPGGFEDLRISSKAFLDWMSNDDTSPHLVAKVMESMNALSRPH